MSLPQNLSTSDLSAGIKNISNAKRLASDLSETEYDPQILFNMLKRDKHQAKKFSKIANSSEEQKNILRDINKRIDFEKFEKQITLTDTNMLTVKLQTFKFLELALFSQKVEENRYSFYSQCATNMAFKLNLFCNVEILEDYTNNQRKQTQKCQSEALIFESQINRILEWNIDLITPSDFLYFFLDYHFSEIDMEDYQKIEEAIVEAYLQYKWSPLSIALGCIDFYLQNDSYLSYLIQYYQNELSNYDFTFQNHEILQVRDFLINLEVSKSDDEEDEENESDEDCDEGENDNLEAEEEDLDSDDLGMSPINENKKYFIESQQNNSDTDSQDQQFDCLPRQHRLNSVSSSQTTITSQSYNKKRSATEYKLSFQDCTHDYEKPTEIKNRCLSQQFIQPVSQYECQNPKLLTAADKYETQSKKKVKTATNIY